MRRGLAAAMATQPADGEDTNALSDPKGKNPDAKVYCPDIGIVMDEELELTNIALP